MKKQLLMLLLWVSASSVGYAQNLTFFGFIPSYSQTGLVSKKLDYNFFASLTNTVFARTYSEIKYPPGILQVYIQPSLIYKYSPNLNFAVSVTYNYQRGNTQTPFFNEYRPWQQILYSHNISKGRLSHRLRFEQRFTKNIHDVRHLFTRLRYQIGYKVPLQGKTLDPHEFYFNCYNEFYFSLSNNPARPRNAFDSENWTYAGAGYHLGKMGILEIGALYQAAYRNRQHERRNLALLQVMWITNFNIVKKKKFTSE